MAHAPHLLKRWLPPIGWLVLIFCASTDLMSAEHTSRFIGPALRWINPAISAAAIGQVQFAIRKAAHVTEYAFLGALLLRALQIGATRSATVTSGLALGIAAICAAFDEFHQSFVPSRTASPIDVAIDIIGAFVGILLYRWFVIGAARRPAG